MNLIKPWINELSRLAILASDMTTAVRTGPIILLSTVAALGGLLFGFDTAIISGAIPFIKTYFSLDAAGLGWAVGSILIGCAVGALFAGRAADRYGRRYVLMICAVLFAVSGLGAATAHALAIFIFFRILGGLGVGAAAMVSPMYIAESVPARLRGRLVSLYQLAIVLGILLAYFSNYLFSDNWRLMFASQVLPAGLFYALLFKVPESPRWLLQKGHREKALDVLKRVNGPDRALFVLREIEASYTAGEGSRVSLAPYKKVLFIGILAAVFQQVTGINAILYYAPVIFAKTGIGASSSLLQTILIGAVNVLSTLVAIGLVDRLGRKRLLAAGSVVMGVLLGGVAACFRFGYYDHYIVLVLILLYVAVFGCTLGAVTWVYLSEIFPNRVRGLALSIATLSLWVADFAVAGSFPVMDEHWGTPATLLTYGIFCFIAFIFFVFRIPETKGKSLEVIESLFTSK